IGTSTVYATIKTLEKKQYITGKVQKDGNMPDKTIYSITEQGTAVLLDTLRTSFLKFDYDTNIFSITAFFLDCLPLEEQKALLEKRMIVLHEYLSGIQKQDTEEWEEQVSLYHVANLQRMTDIVLAEINGTERLIKVVTAK
ncbi:TPA: PadR family transcriptional regulator, partial [Clostridioides difficile]|nr:PadR family transcriptional regulator [Clostridioides difficile]